MIALLLSGIVSGQWVHQDPDFYSGSLSDIFFVDDYHGWVGSDLSLRTTDGGNNWEFMGLVETSSIFFTDQNLGWGTQGGNIKYTLNGGIYWDYPQNGITGYEWISIYFADSLNGWALGMDWGFYANYFIIINTSNGGDDWIEQISGSCGQFRSMSDIKFIDENMGWAVGNEDMLLKTTDGGNNWNPQSTGLNTYPMYELKSISFVDSLNGWIVGNNVALGPADTGIILYTTNGGETWEQQFLDTIPLSDVCFVDELNGWAVGLDGAILHTNDSGDSWDLQESGTLVNLHSVCFIDQNMGWICGDSGVILHTDNGGIVGVEDNYSEPVTFKVYPNPSKSTITIELPAQPSKNTSLTISNTNGQQLINQPITKPQTEIDISHLPVGIYIVKVWNEKDVMVRKVIKQ